MTINSKSDVQEAIRRALTLHEMTGNAVVRQVCEDLIEIARYHIELDDRQQAMGLHPSAGNAGRVTGTEISQIGSPRVVTPSKAAREAWGIPPKPPDAPDDIRWNGTHWVRGS